jgi:hypothetical protein
MFDKTLIRKIGDTDFSDALVEPFTPIDKLELNQNDMKYKCEAYFLNLQGKIIRGLEKIEANSFTVERILKENVNSYSFI